jgi:hypothetical protein
MLVKRVLYRRLEPLSRLALEPDPFRHLVKISPGMGTEFAMLYFVGTKVPEVER